MQIRRKLIIAAIAATLALPAAAVSPPQVNADILWSQGMPYSSQGVLEAVDWQVTLTNSMPLYEAPYYRSAQAGVLQPQTVRVTGFYNGFYRIETEQGERWLYPAGNSLINYTEIDQTITLQTTTDIYPINSNRSMLKLAPQSVRAVAKADNNLYLIKTWAGDAWIQMGNFSLVDKTETLTEAATLYSEPSQFGIATGSLAPQDIHVTALYDGYRRIETPEGFRWYKPRGTIFGREAVDERITLSGITGLFDYPDATSRRAGELKPQAIRAIAKAEGGWYQVSTWIGDKWLHPDIAAPAAVAPFNGSLELIHDNYPLYQYPNEAAKQLYAMYPQTLQATGKAADGWYRVDYFGTEGWVHLPDEALPVTINKTIELISITPLWTYPNTWISAGARLGPQQVQATMQWGDWYKINTWLGPRWIQIKETP